MKRLPALGLVLLGLLPSAGCSRPQVAKVSGKVTFQKKTVPSGTVTFLSDDNRVETAEIQEDGSYTMAKAPVGPVKIAVTTYQPWAPPTKSQVPGQPPEAPPAQKPFVKVPDTYRNPETSGLTWVVELGEHTHDLELK
ncbi:MAG TPA: hypothetical protein VKA46_16070 [Gemmataceae bacterium]|nr:hypothetical protein [Gemmataceae bacterium]